MTEFKSLQHQTHNSLSQDLWSVEGSSGLSPTHYPRKLNTEPLEPNVYDRDKTSFGPRITEPTLTLNKGAQFHDSIQR